MINFKNRLKPFTIALSAVILFSFIALFIHQPSAELPKKSDKISNTLSLPADAHLTALEKVNAHLQSDMVAFQQRENRIQNLERDMKKLAIISTPHKSRS